MSILIVDQDSNEKPEAMREEEYLDDQIDEVPIDPEIEDISGLIRIYAKAGQYAVASKQWNQLENILISFWNCLTYFIPTPLEYGKTNAYKDIFLLAEQCLQLLEHFNDVDYDIFKNKNLDTTEFSLPKKPSPLLHISSPSFEFFVNLLCFALQLLFIYEKYETIISTISTFNKISSNYPDFADGRFRHYSKIWMMDLKVYSLTTIYEKISVETKNKRDELKLRIQQFNIGNSFTLL